MKKEIKKYDNTESSSGPNFTHEALTFFKNKKTGKWTVGTMGFDPLLMEVDGDVKFHAEYVEKQSAVEAFKIQAAKTLFNNGDN